MSEDKTKTPQEDDSWDTDDAAESVDIVESNTEDDIAKLNINKGEIVNVHSSPIKKIPCIIPRKLFDSIQEIERLVREKFHCDQEFSIYLHGDYDNDGNLIISDTFYIPKQNVSGASVDYKEEPHSFYNGCLHRHPNGVTSFSGTDEKYINSNFEFSLLYVNNHIHTGIVNIVYHNNRRLQALLDVKLERPAIMEDIAIDNITKFEYRPQIVTPPLVSGGAVTMPQVYPYSQQSLFSGADVNSAEEEDESLIDGTDSDYDNSDEEDEELVESDEDKNEFMNWVLGGNL